MDKNEMFNCEIYRASPGPEEDLQGDQRRNEGSTLVPGPRWDEIAIKVMHSETTGESKTFDCISSSPYPAPTGPGLQYNYIQFKFS